MKKYLLLLISFCALTIAQSFSQCAVSISATNITCNGNADGTATANPSGGTAPYTYLWNPTSQTSQIATGLAAGNYTVIVTDALACTATATATIAPSPALGIIYPPPPAGCSPYTGTVTANPFGGTPPYTYLWSTTPPQTTQTATGLAPGNYTVTVTDSHGCSLVGTETVSQSNLPSVSVSSTQSSCAIANGTATANPSGGTGAYTYSWSTSPPQHNQTSTGLAIGDYTVLVTDANGCTATGTVNITPTSAPTVYCSANPTTITSGNSATLSAWGSGTYQWSPTTGLNCTTCANPIATPSATTIYCVTAIDANGCKDTTCVTVYLTSTGIQFFTDEIFISVFPNPFSTQTTLQTNENLRNATLSVYNLYGQEVKEINNISGKTITFSRGNLPSGLYFLRLTEGDKTFATEKLIITGK